MSTQPAITDMPTPEVQEQKNRTVSSNKKVRPQDEALEKLSVLVRVGDRKQLFDLDLARRREAVRRIKMLGTFAREEYEKKQLRAFAREHYVPERELVTWKHDYLLHGFDGLLPQDWAPLTEKAQAKVLERLEILKELVDAVMITGDDVYELAKRQGWNYRKAERLVRRYQIDGVWGLVPERDPERIHRPRNQKPLVDFAAAPPDQRAEAERRLDLIKPYLGRRRIPNEELKTHARKHSTPEHTISLRTLRDYLAKYKKWGLDGLLPKAERSDKGHPHNMKCIFRLASVHAC